MRFGDMFISKEANSHITNVVLKNHLVAGHDFKSYLIQAKGPGGAEGEFQHTTFVPGPSQFLGICHMILGEEDYQAWVEEQKGAAAAEAAAAGKTWSMDELMAKGEAVYKTNCLACHQAEGEGLPAAGFPALKGSAIATGPVAGHIDIVMNGSKQNPAMAAYAGQLNDVDLAAVITYERNAFGNTAGDMVQPADIAAAR